MISRNNIFYDFHSKPMAIGKGYLKAPAYHLYAMIYQGL